MRRKERTYSKEEKASTLAVLDSNEGKAFPTANETGLPRTTIINWRDGKGVDEEVQEIRQKKKEELSDIFERVARKYLAQAEDSSVISATKGKDAVVSACAATDKVQLLRGRATSIAGKESDFEEAKRILEFHREHSKDFTESQVYTLLIKPVFPQISAEELGVSVVVKGDEGTEPAP